MLRRAMMGGGGGGGAGNTDNFDTDSFGSYSQYSNNTAQWTISGGKLQGSATVGAQAVIVRDGVVFADGEASAVISQAADAGVVLRFTDNSNYLLAAISDASGATPNKVTLYRRTGGAFTQVAQASISFPRGTPKALSFSMTGTGAVVKFDGMTIIESTITTNVAAGRCGMRSTAGLQLFDSFTWP